MRKILIGLFALLLATAPALAQSIQLPAGQVLGNSTAAQRPGRAETITAMLDRALGSTRGAILERGAAAWSLITPGTAGLAFVSAGAGADPLYGIVGLNGGGCNAALTASNGGILYSTATACSILPGTATARQMLQSGASAAPAWSTTTWPATTTINRLLWSSAANVISDLATANSGVLVTSAGGVPSISTTLPTGLAMGTPASITLTNATGLPISTGLTGAGTGVLAALAVNIGSAGAPVLFNGAGGTPSSITLTNGTGLPISTGLTGAGTGVLAALAVNIGSAGAPVLFNGALGSPSSVGTMPAHTLGGTISGGGNQINNVVIGTTTPLAGTFTLIQTKGAANQGVDILNTGLATQVFFRWNAAVGGYFGLMNVAAVQTATLFGEGTNDNYFAPTGVGAAFGFNTTTPTTAQTGNVGMVTSNGGFKHSVVTFANLPTCNAANAGARYGVSNSNTAVFLANIAGGGANLVPAYCNGANWVVG